MNGTERKKAPPDMGSVEGVEGMTNGQASAMLQAVIDFVNILIPDTPEQSKLLEVLQRIKKNL